MPGHTYEGVKDLPGDLVACQNIFPDWSTDANEPPSGQLKLGNDAFAIIAKLLKMIEFGVGAFANYATITDQKRWFIDQHVTQTGIECGQSFRQSPV